MAKVYVFLVVLICVPVFSYAQKIEKMEIDKFTKQEVIETTIEKLISDYVPCQKGAGAGTICGIKFQIRRCGGVYSMPAILRTERIVKYEDGDGIVLLLDNDETITLKSSYTGVSKLNHDFSTCFTLTDDDVEQLKTHKVLSVRIKYMGNHEDFDLKKNKQDLIMKSLHIFDDLNNPKYQRKKYEEYEF